MEVIYRVDEYRAFRDARGGSVGFVPTMGALHEGHASLLMRSKEECDCTVLSVYVNPTQFDNANDLDKYPRTLERDIALAESLGVDVVLAPDYDQLYPDGYRYRLSESEESRTLCGAHRPGHFDGVLTVVMKLFNIVRPTRAYFGEKDYQQLHLIAGMADAFFLPVEIVACPTFRHADGLAMSSRNANLDAAARVKAPHIFDLIGRSLSDEEIAARLTAEGFRVDYVETRFGRRFVAARIGEEKQEVRLIDNVALPGE